MEGPSIVLATEEFSKYIAKPIKKVSGTAKLPLTQMKKWRLTELRSWGKHLLLTFGENTIRVHFMMFGSYRINNPRENRIPKLELQIAGDTIYFYSCAMKILEEEVDELYDWSIDLMSKKWSPGKAATALAKKPGEMVCDLLMDQTIFAGLGNIMKNEILFNRRLHPETRAGELPAEEQKALIKEARAYAFQFLKWKKANVLKKNWQIFRKKKCPVCERAVTKRPTGKGERISHYCEHCQPLRETVREIPATSGKRNIARGRVPKDGNALRT